MKCHAQSNLLYLIEEKKNEKKKWTEIEKGDLKMLTKYCVLNSIILHSSISFECNPIAFSDYFRFVWKCFVLTQIDAKRFKYVWFDAMRCAKCCGFFVSLSQTFGIFFFFFFFDFVLFVFILLFLVFFHQSLMIDLSDARKY